MKNKLILLLLLFTSIVAYSQDEDVLRPNGRDINESERYRNRQNSSNSTKNPWSYGFDVGLNFNFFSQTMTGLQQDSRLAVFESGTGFSQFVGVYVDYALTDETGIQLKLSIDKKDFSNSNDAIRDAIMPDLSVVDAFVTGEFETSASFITLTPQFRWNINQEFFLLAGPTIHIKSVNASQNFKEIINSPEDVYYNVGTPDQSKTFESNTDNLEINATRVGLQFDLGYMYKVTPELTFVPKLGFQYMATTFGQDEDSFDDTKYYSTPPFPGTVPITANDKMLHSIQLSIGIWYNF